MPKQTRRLRYVFGLAVLCGGLAVAAEPPLPTADARTLYTLGQLISRTLENFTLTAEELDYVRLGLEDGVLQRDPKVNLAAEAPRLHEMQTARRSAQLEQQRSQAAQYLATTAAAPNVIRYDNGILVEPVVEGAGATPSTNDYVSVHYEGRLIDGTIFDSSRARGEPAVFAVQGVIPCWSQALPNLRVGSRVHLTCPAELAYGDRGVPPSIKPGATLIFDLELLGLVR